MCRADYTVSPRGVHHGSLQTTPHRSQEPKRKAPNLPRIVKPCVMVKRLLITIYTADHACTTGQGHYTTDPTGYNHCGHFNI